MSNNLIDELILQFEKNFKSHPGYYIDTGGRFEICGNHTDHNHGLCLVANCSLRISALAKKDSKKVRIKSAGYSYFEFGLDDLEFDPNEPNKSMLLAKGVLFRLKELGYNIGGFDAVIKSNIPDGSGVSSSAAIESLYGYIISYLYNDGKIPNLVIAQTGQYSENNYFGKPSGLLDQIGTSFNSFNYIDFKNIKDPEIKTKPFNFQLKLYLIKSEGNHANLTPLYAAIPTAMYKVANLLEGKKFLRDIEDTNEIFNKIDKLDATEDEKRKAKHFFIENENVKQALNAIETNNLEEFLDAIRKSQKSSKENLKNTFVEGEYENSPQNIIDECTEFLKDKGAIRIHGGGFKGTVLAFVKKEFENEFDEFLKKTYPQNRYFKVSISDKAINFIDLNKV